MRSLIRVMIVILVGVSTPTVGALGQGLPPQDLPLIGSSGGTFFERTCPAGSVVGGFRWRSGAVLDAVGIMCRRVRADGSLGPNENVGTLAGGAGGTAGSAVCNSVAAGQQGVFQVGIGVAIFMVHCYEWFPASRSWGGSRRGHVALVASGVATAAFVVSSCASGNQPVTGIRGRAGNIVDALALRCNEP